MNGATPLETSVSYLGALFVLSAQVGAVHSVHLLGAFFQAGFAAVSWSRRNSSVRHHRPARPTRA